MSCRDNLRIKRTSSQRKIQVRTSDDFRSYMIMLGSVPRNWPGTKQQCKWYASDFGASHTIPLTNTKNIAEQQLHQHAEHAGSAHMDCMIFFLKCIFVCVSLWVSAQARIKFGRRLAGLARQSSFPVQQCRQMQNAARLRCKLQNPLIIHQE